MLSRDCPLSVRAMVFTRMFRRLVGVLAVPLTLGVPAFAIAADRGVNPFSTPAGGAADIYAIAPGRTFIAEASGEAKPILAPLTLHIKASAWNKIADIRRVRLFRLGASDLPSPAFSLGDCDVFLTAVLGLQKGADYIQMPELTRPYLEVDVTHTTLKSSRWIAVFETSDEESSPVFRLRQFSKKEYFAGGWICKTLTATPFHQLTSSWDEPGHAAIETFRSPARPGLSRSPAAQAHLVSCDSCTVSPAHQGDATDTYSERRTSMATEFFFPGVDSGWLSTHGDGYQVIATLDEVSLWYRGGDTRRLERAFYCAALRTLLRRRLRWVAPPLSERSLD